MVGPRFLYGYASSGATATATATASGYDPSNAVSIERATTWLGVGTSSQRLMLHMGSAITPTGLGICGGNYASWGATTNLQYSSDGSSWTTQMALSSLPSTDSTQDYFATITAAPSRAWWALQFTTLVAAPELSVFYLGTLATLSENYQFPFEGSDVYGVDVQQSEGRIVTAEQVARRRQRFPLEFLSPDSTAALAMQAIIQSEGGPLRPFFFVPVDESGSSTAGRAYLVRYETGVFALKRLHVNPYSFTVPLLEEV